MLYVFSYGCLVSYLRYSTLNMQHHADQEDKPFNTQIYEDQSDNQCVDIAEENELLRAKLGHLGLPTDGIPEEDDMPIHSKYTGLCDENQLLKAKLNSYTNPESMNDERADDWKVKYDLIIKSYKRLKSALQNTDEQV